VSPQAGRFDTFPIFVMLAGYFAQIDVFGYFLTLCRSAGKSCKIKHFLQNDTAK